MDNEIFQTELQKYRVVRRPDYCKVLWKQKSASLTNTQHASSITIDSTVRNASSSNSVLSEDGIWKNIEEILRRDVSISASQRNAIIGHMQTNYDHALAHLNLSDLDELAEAIK